MKLFFNLLVPGFQMVNGVDLRMRHLALGMGFQFPELQCEGLMQSS